MATVKKPKKILMITPFFKPNIGGVENHLDDLCNYLNKKGHQITILTFTPLTTKISAPSFEQQQKHITIHRFSWPGHNLFHQLEPYPILEFLYLTPYLFLRSLFFLIFTKQKFDLIHAHGLNASFVTMLLKKIFKIRTVASTYAIYNFQKSSLFSKITSFTLSSFDKILALAQPSTKELIKIGID
ncbi:glycosyltransferase, partial [Patescibacteria group bacterium]|nr:glycosyltransferase [Patescibacteria group bacterium]